MEKEILPIPLELNFTPNTLGCYGLKINFSTTVSMERSREPSIDMVTCNDEGIFKNNQITHPCSTFILEDYPKQGFVPTVCIFGFQGCISWLLIYIGSPFWWLKT